MQGPGDAVCAPAMQNAFEDQWVQEAMAASLLDVGGAAAQPASPAAGDGREFWATRTAVANEDEELQRALAASAVETVPSELGGMGRCSSEEDPDLQRALRESAGVVQATVRVRRLMAPEAGTERSHAVARMLHASSQHVCVCVCGVSIGGGSLGACGVQLCRMHHM